MDNISSTIVPVVYYLVHDHHTAYGSFVELLKAHPEISVDHPDYDPAKTYKVMNREDWERWVDTGIRECEMVMV